MHKLATARLDGDRQVPRPERVHPQGPRLVGLTSVHVRGGRTVHHHVVGTVLGEPSAYGTLVRHVEHVEVYEVCADTAILLGTEPTSAPMASKQRLNSVRVALSRQ